MKKLFFLLLITLLNGSANAQQNIQSIAVGSVAR
jgi:hypothetical protein